MSARPGRVFGRLIHVPAPERPQKSAWARRGVGKPAGNFEPDLVHDRHQKGRVLAVRDDIPDQRGKALIGAPSTSLRGGRVPARSRFP
jgi:hypothetical protein